MRSLLVALALALGGCMDQPAPGPELPVSHPEALLRMSPYPHLLVEIDYVDGYEPDPAVLADLAGILESVTDKRTIRILPPTEIPRQPDQHSENDLWRLHLDTFDHRGPDHGFGSNGTLHILYVNGASEDDEFQGIYNGAAVLLPDYWRGTFGPASVRYLPHALDSPTEQGFERAVLVHEIGHTLGLVNRGAPMLMERATDDGCRCHSIYADSVMSRGLHEPAQDPMLAVQEMGLEPVWRFDEHDLADLAAFRTGATGPPVRATSPSSP